MSLKIQYLSKKSMKDILKSIESRTEVDRTFIDTLKQSEEVRIASDKDFNIIVFDAAPMLFRVNEYDTYIPTLYALNYFYTKKGVHILPTVVVDEGAIKPLLRGADVMIPGIRKVIANFFKGQLVAVMNSSEKYFIVVGVALVDSVDIAPNSKGKCIANVSHLEDDIWKASLQLVRSLSK
ncbi:MAG: DUF1947 domain-containing protein [Ignisphaera sp.]|nr:DUF1947 domain-containing protein [Ignisphaera sp.]MCX8168516.1 DUF1947 domain-containing protein [Ignisphaera sp.]MDW8085045.1 DUF1947 domain-containing protein [Ignisphaera sp.]